MNTWFPRVSYKNYLLTLLMLVLAFSYVDRMLFGLVFEHIKSDLGLTDTQLGILSGVGYALFFAMMGIPIARWGDRGNRILVISLTTAVWSVAVALCGMAGGFLQLFLVRIGVAAGEAGCSPLANSLIPDYFSRPERPRAVARYLTGVSVGLTVGYFAGGWLNELYGWRNAFIIIGLPGLALAALTALTLEEPRRGRGAKPADCTVDISKQASLKEVVVVLWGNTTFRNLLLFCLIWYFSGWGFTQWQPTFFIRSHGMATGELGTWLAAIYGTAGILGTWLGGEWASRYAAQNERVQLFGAAGLFAVEATFNTISLLVPNHYAAFAAVALGNLAECMAIGPIFATIQTLVPANMRATAQALLSLLPSFLGAGFGPLLAGALSDWMHPWAGKESLRYALIVFCPGYLWAAWHLLCASRTVARDLRRAVVPESSGGVARPHLVTAE